jgi:hypothetical protein
MFQRTLIAIALTALATGCGSEVCSDPATCGISCADGACAAGDDEPDAPPKDDGADDPFEGGEGGPGGESCGSASFQVTETQESFAVPEGVSYLRILAWGAGGNGEGACPYDDSGLGGFTEAVFAVTPGEPLVLIVGKRGRSGMTGEERVKFGFGEWGGGGLTGVFRGSEGIDETSQNRALVIAGGGGSAGAPGCHPGLPGNHPDAGGESTMLGGAGADQINGGGGGYEGGLGGAKGEASRGGSGFVSLEAITSTLAYAEPGTELPPHTDDPDYDGSAGTGETSGLLVMHFGCEPPQPL